MIFFTFQAQSLFKQAVISLPSLPCNVSHSKQAAIFFIPTLLFPLCQFYPLTGDQIYSWSVSLYLPFVYKAQFSIDSLLIGMVISGIFRSSCSSRHRSQFLPLVYASWRTLLALGAALLFLSQLICRTTHIHDGKSAPEHSSHSQCPGTGTP